jgi:hypothetical protein
MRIIFCALIIAVGFWNCTGSEYANLPQNVVSREQIRSIMAEMLMVESSIQMHSIKIDSEKVVATQYYDQILKRHNLTREQLYSSIIYYSSHPEIMEDEYKPVIDSLSALEARMR